MDVAQGKGLTDLPRIKLLPRHFHGWVKKKNLLRQAFPQGTFGKCSNATATNLAWHTVQWNVFFSRWSVQWTNGPTASSNNYKHCVLWTVFGNRIKGSREEKPRHALGASLSNHDHNNVKLCKFKKTAVLHTLDVRFSLLFISQSLSTSQRLEMTCFAVASTTLALQVTTRFWFLLSISMPLTPIPG